MNANAQKWVEALESGDYAQTQSVLRDSSGYCCLGVACDLYHRETGLGKWIEREIDFAFMPPDGDDKYRVVQLPPVVRAWLGLRDALGSYDGDRDSLAAHNDQAEPFTDIAEIIKSEPQGLFARTVA